MSPHIQKREDRQIESLLKLSLFKYCGMVFITGGHSVKRQGMFVLDGSWPQLHAHCRWQREKDL